MAIDIGKAELLVENFRQRQGSLIELLLDIQDEFNYVPEPVLTLASERLAVPLERLLGAATFYNAFSTTPKGRFHVKVCTGTACVVRGARSVLETVIGGLNIGPGEVTDNGAYSLESVHCVGACALGPVVVVGGEYHGHMTTKKAAGILSDLKQKEAASNVEEAQAV
jgi:NADH-quinone oxidoreductase subunit E